MSRKSRMEREAEQAALAAARDRAPRRRGTASAATRAVAHDADECRPARRRRAGRCRRRALTMSTGSAKPSAMRCVRDRRGVRQRAARKASAAIQALPARERSRAAPRPRHRRRQRLTESRISRSSSTSSGGGGRRLRRVVSRFSRLICCTIRKMTNARMTKLIDDGDEVAVREQRHAGLGQRLVGHRPGVARGRGCRA